MYRLPVKPLLVGLGLGVLLFAIPFFLLKALLFFLLVGATVRFFSRIRRSSPHRGRYAPYGLAWHPAFSDTIRAMSDEDYDTFRQQLANEPYPASSRMPRTTIEIQ